MNPFANYEVSIDDWDCYRHAPEGASATLNTSFSDASDSLTDTPLFTEVARVTLDLSGKTPGLKVSQSETSLETLTLPSENSLIKNPATASSNHDIHVVKDPTVFTFFESQLEISEAVLLNTLKRYTNLDLQASEHSLERSLENAKMKVNPQIAKALDIAYVGYLHLRDNTPLSEKHSIDAIRSAYKILNNFYDRHLTLVGKIIGRDRGSWDIIETPYINETRGTWSRTESRKPLGSVTIKRNGFRIGDRVNHWHKDKPAVVVDARHQFGALGTGTATVLLQYLDGTLSKAVPWGVELDTSSLTKIDMQELDMRQNVLRKGQKINQRKDSLLRRIGHSLASILSG